MMSQDYYKKRLEDLSKNITRERELLEQFEEVLSYEDNPRRKSGYLRDIERQRESITKYQQEFDELQQKLKGIQTDVGVNHTRLLELLAAEKWEEANQETIKVMLKAAKQEERGWLDKEDLEKFPCTDLCTIDRLWVKYSNGRFGISIQTLIWKSVGGKLGKYDYEICKKFGEQVGWYIKNNDAWLTKEKHTFTLSAPHGHLPVFYWYLLDEWTGIFSRLENCGL